MSLSFPVPPFTIRAIPEIRYGAGLMKDIGALAAPLADASRSSRSSRSVAIIADAAMGPLGHLSRLEKALTQAGARSQAFTDIAGDPKVTTAEAARDFIRRHDAGLVVCLGGGSAMDVGKTAATLAFYEKPILDYTMSGMSGAAITHSSLPKICIPTSSGTGSELSSTNILSDDAGRKIWVWSALSKPDLALLDPQLSLTLPPDLTAWSGLDAFSHCLESCTNNRTHRAIDLFSHKGLALIAGALETAVKAPDNIEARGQIMLGSAYGGIAIDNCNAAMAHNISHALAALAPVHHGLATGLAMAVLMPWWVAVDTDGAFARAAAACGLEANAHALSSWYGDWLDRLGVERRLPKAFSAFTADDLAREMLRPETSYMRQSNARLVSDDDMARFARQTMAMGV